MTPASIPSNTSGIYLIRNTRDGKKYVGQTASFRRRWSCHRSALERGKHPNVKLQRAWDCHGSEAFAFEIVELAVVALLDEREQHWMDTLKPEYNLAPFAGSNRGHKPSPETIARRVTALQGQKRTPEQRRRISEAKKARIAERKAMGIVQASPMRGRQQSESSRKKISRNRAGKGGGERSPEWRSNISKAVRGRCVSAETRAKISLAFAGRPSGRGYLSEAQVREIRRLHGLGYGRVRIGRMMEIPSHLASVVIRGGGYLWVK